MAVRVGWYEKEKVFYFEFSGNITSTDMTWAVKEASKIVEMYPDALIHSVTDLTHADKLMLPLREIIGAMGALKKAKLPGWAVVIGNPNAMFQFAVSTLGQVFGFRFRIFATLDEGLKFLNEVDDALPPLLPIHEVAYFEHIVDAAPSIQR